MEPRPDVLETWYTMRNVTDTERASRLRVGARYLGVLQAITCRRSFGCIGAHDSIFRRWYRDRAHNSKRPARLDKNLSIQAIRQAHWTTVSAENPAVDNQNTCDRTTNGRVNLTTSSNQLGNAVWPVYAQGVQTLIPSKDCYGKTYAAHPLVF